MSTKKYSYVGISFVVLVFGIIFVPKIIDRISNQDITRDGSRSEDVSKSVEKKSRLAYIEINGERKKIPPFSFTDQNENTITNKDYLGKVYVVEFFFTTCPTICPRMNRNLVEVQNTFKEFEDFGIASFTINPEHDTPKVLKAYADKYGVVNPNWHFMTGNKNTIYKLANEGFNLYTAKDDRAEGGFEHSGNFALIDKEGYIRSRLDTNGNPIIYYNGIISEKQQVDDEGYKEEISLLKEDIKKLLLE